MIDNIFNSLKKKYFNTEKRFLGIDYGEINVGIAISDVGRQIASPYVMLKNKGYKNLVSEIAKIVVEMDVAVIVIGMPLQMDGSEGETAFKIRDFAEYLKKSLPYIEVVFADERMSSVMVEKMLIRDFDLSRKKRKNILDKVAAAEILQRVLDS